MISKIQCCDCLDGLRQLNAQSVSVIITSPPYNIGIQYLDSSDRRIDYLDWLQNIFAECMRVLNDDGHFFLQVGGIATNPTIPWEILARAILSDFKLQNQIVWVKNISVDDESYGQFKPINSTRFLNNTYEFIFHLTKTGNVNVDRLAIGVPLKHKSNLKRFNHQKDVRCRGNVWFIPYETIQSKQEKYNHPAIFPVALPEMCIKFSGIQSNSLVLDPFAGSGSTLVACDNLDMQGLGFDISSEYCSITQERLNNLKRFL